MAVMWLKFFAFDSALSPRHTLSFVTFAGSVGVLACLSAPLLLLPQKARGAAFVALDVLLSALILTDELMLRYYADLFSFHNIAISGQADEVWESIVALLKPQDIKYFADAPAFALLSQLARRRGEWRAFSIRRAVAVCALAAVGAAGTAWKISDYDRAVPGAIRSLWDRPAVAISTGSLVYHAADALYTAEERISKKKYSEKDAERLTGWLADRALRRKEREAGTFGIASGKNLIMIQVEALQAFTVGLETGGVEVAPNMRKLSEESLYFTRAFNQTASGNSSDAEFMANASMYPTAKGVAFVRFAGNMYNSLGSELRELGYATASFHGDKPGFWNRNHMYPALGFDQFISKLEFEPGEGIGLGLSDRDFFEQTLYRLVDMKNGGRPFYAFLVTLTSHYPFGFGALKKHVTDLPLGDLEDTLLGDYLRSIRYVDGQLGRFMEGLEREGLLDESVIALYGDHPAIPRKDAPALGALLGRDLSSLPSWREIQSIPIMIRLPGGAMSRSFDIPTGQMDIAPTVASLMGFTVGTAFGDDLLDPALERSEKLVAFRNGSFIKGDVWALPGERKAFDLRTGENAPYAEQCEEAALEAANALALSDMTLEGDMIRKIPSIYGK
jgi:phosphoglycerol transferase MdoB-like AlkP superfamily enzyme